MRIDKKWRDSSSKSRRCFGPDQLSVDFVEQSCQPVAAAQQLLFDQRRAFRYVVVGDFRAFGRRIVDAGADGNRFEHPVAGIAQQIQQFRLRMGQRQREKGILLP